MLKATVQKIGITPSNPKSFEINSNDGKVILDDKDFDLDLRKIKKNYYHIIKDGKSYNAELLSQDSNSKEYRIKINGQIYQVRLKDRLDLLLEKWGMSDTQDTTLQILKAPMPGLVIDIQVKNGTEVKKGDPLLVLEAMKMENVLKSAGDGVVKNLLVSPGQSVEKNQLLIEF